MSASVVIEPRPGGRFHVTIAGVIDEMTDLSPLIGLTGPIEIDTHAVRRFNSAGVRIWVDCMRALAVRARLSFVDCAPAVITQLNMIQGFLGHGRVRSFYGPMRCDRCDHMLNHRFETHVCVEQGGLPSVACPSCGATMELDELEDSYLLFLREPTQVR